MDREEMKVETLEGGYVRVTMVLHSSVLPFHVKGEEAAKRIVKFALNFAAGAFPCCRSALLKHVYEMPDDSADESPSQQTN